MFFLVPFPIIQVLLAQIFPTLQTKTTSTFNPGYSAFAVGMPATSPHVHLQALKV
jgi:hypothetical protein